MNGDPSFCPPSDGGVPGTGSAMRKGRFYGKYRGTVISNLDPEFRGRVLPYVPHIPGALLNWAEPCVPYAGPGVGFYAVPPIGASVWIEFEGGNPNFPIWSGCFWKTFLENLTPIVRNPLNPTLVKVLKTFFSTLMFDDTPAKGGLFLQSTPPAVGVPVTMQFTVQGASINCGASTILMTPESISIVSGTISQTAATTISAKAGGSISQDAALDATLQAGASVGIKAVGAANFEAGGAATVKATGSASLQGATTEVAAVTELSLRGGAGTKIVGGTNVTLSSLGPVDVSGTAVTISGPSINFLPA